MIAHLTSEQLSNLIAGDATAQQTQHASECPVCSDEVNRVKDAMGIFRDSVHRWAERNGASTVPDISFAPRRSFGIRWILAAVAALIVLIVAPLYKKANDQKRSLEAAEDTLLLEQVNAHLARTVPESMEPLMKLISNASVEESGGRQ
jgi:hypothetical protein